MRGGEVIWNPGPDGLTKTTRGSGSDSLKNNADPVGQIKKERIEILPPLRALLYFWYEIKNFNKYL